MISQNCGNSVIFLQALALGHEFAEGLFLFAFQNGDRIEEIVQVKILWRGEALIRNLKHLDPVQD